MNQKDRTMEELASGINKVTKEVQAEANLRSLQVLAITYNLAGGVFDIEKDREECLAQMDDLFRKNDTWHDIYVLGT